MPTQNITLTSPWQNVTTALNLVDGAKYSCQAQGPLVVVAETVGSNPPAVSGRRYATLSVFGYRQESGVNLWAQGIGQLIVDNA